MARILIIEDDEQIRGLLRQILERKGHDTHEASEGASGLKAYRKYLPDLVITDLIMPGKEGIETITELRHLNPEARIIAISGGGKMEPEIYLDLARKLGASAIVKKPFTQKEILNAVDHLLPKSDGK